MPWIVLPRTPGAEFVFERVGQSSRGRERDDRTDVQIVIGPSIQSPADTLRKRIIDGRVTQSARDAEAGDLIVLVDLPFESDDRIQFEQLDCDRGTRQVDLSSAQGSRQLRR